MKELGVNMEAKREVGSQINDVHLIHSILYNHNLTLELNFENLQLHCNLHFEKNNKLYQNKD